MNLEQSIVPSREQLLYWLHEAAEIEHRLMRRYLYAVFGLNRADACGTSAQAQALMLWQSIMTGIALEAMTHLRTVANWANAIGTTPHFNRPMFPINLRPYPFGLVIRPQPFLPDMIADFQFHERPNDTNIADGAGTRRTAARMTDARLCRCRQLNHKPFAMVHASLLTLSPMEANAT